RFCPLPARLKRLSPSPGTRLWPPPAMNTTYGLSHQTGSAGHNRQLFYSGWQETDTSASWTSCSPLPARATAAPYPNTPIWVIIRASGTPPNSVTRYGYGQTTQDLSPWLPAWQVAASYRSKQSHRAMASCAN